MVYFTSHVLAVMNGQKVCLQLDFSLYYIWPLAM